MLKILVQRISEAALDGDLEVPGYAGVDGELAINSSNYSLRVFNGVTDGGYEIKNSTQVSTLISDLQALADDNAADLVTIDGLITAINSALANKLETSTLGANNGTATLDANGKIPLSELSLAVTGQLNYQGTWAASTDTPSLPDPTTVKGHYYVASDSGTFNLLDFVSGDWVVSNGTTWEKVDNTEAVASVAGKTGVITLVKGDVGLGNVDNTSDADKPVSTALQTALDLKADLDSPDLTGVPTAPTQADTDDSTRIATTEFVNDVIAITPHGVSSVQGTAPIDVDNTDSANPVVSIDPATGATDGSMSAADKTKLDGVATGAQANTVDSVAGKTGAVTLDNADAGLGNVENYVIATEQEAIDADIDTAYATPLRIRNFLESLGFEEY